MKDRTNLPKVCTRCGGTWTQELAERVDWDDPSLFVGAKRCESCDLKYVYCVWRPVVEQQPSFQWSV